MGRGEMARRITHGWIARRFGAQTARYVHDARGDQFTLPKTSIEVVGAENPTSGCKPFGLIDRADQFSRKDAMRQPHIDDYVRWFEEKHGPWQADKFSRWDHRPDMLGEGLYRYAYKTGMTREEGMAFKNQHLKW